MYLFQVTSMGHGSRKVDVRFRRSQREKQSEPIDAMDLQVCIVICHFRIRTHSHTHKLAVARSPFITHRHHSNIHIRLLGSQRLVFIENEIIPSESYAIRACICHFVNGVTEMERRRCQSVSRSDGWQPARMTDHRGGGGGDRSWPRK